MRIWPQDQIWCKQLQDTENWAKLAPNQTKMNQQLAKAPKKSHHSAWSQHQVLIRGDLLAAILCDRLHCPINSIPFHEGRRVHRNQCVFLAFASKNIGVVGALQVGEGLGKCCPLRSPLPHIWGHHSWPIPWHTWPVPAWAAVVWLGCGTPR